MTLAVALQVVRAQACYTELENATGLSLTEYQPRLNAAACLLRDTFPAEFRSQFGVYSFSYYLHTEATRTGKPAVLQGVIDSIQQLTPYYLLFALESAPDGLFRSMKVDLKLPDTGLFSCMSGTDRALLKEELQRFVNKIYPAGTAIFDRTKIITAKEQVISELRNAVIKTTGCCVPGDVDPPTCTPCPDEELLRKLKDHFVENKFYQIPIKIYGKIIVENPPVAVQGKTPEKDGELILDYASELKIQFSRIDPVKAPDSSNVGSIKSVLEQLLVLPAFRGIAQSNKKGYITANESFCASTASTNDLFDVIPKAVDDLEFGFWAHIYEESPGEGILYVRVKVPRGRRPSEGEVSTVMDSLQKDASLYSYPSRFNQHTSVVFFSMLSICSATTPYQIGKIKRDLGNSAYTCAKPIVIPNNNAFQLTDPFLYGDRLYIYQPKDFIQAPLYTTFTPNGELYVLPKEAEAVYYPDNVNITVTDPVIGAFSYPYSRGAMVAFRNNNTIYGGYRDEATLPGKAIFMGYAPMNPSDATISGPFLESMQPVDKLKVYAGRRSEKQCEGELLRGEMVDFNLFSGATINNVAIRETKDIRIEDGKYKFQVIGTSDGHWSTICGCRNKNYSERERELLNRYRTLGMLRVEANNDPLTRVLCDNPLLLENTIIGQPEIWANIQSEWILGLKNITAGMVGAGLSIPVVATLLPLVLEDLAFLAGEAAAKEVLKDKLQEVVMDIGLQAFFIYYFPESDTSVVNTSYILQRIEWGDAAVSIGARGNMNAYAIDTKKNKIDPDILKQVAGVLINCGLAYDGKDEDKFQTFLNCIKEGVKGILLGEIFLGNGSVLKRLKSLSPEAFDDGLDHLSTDLSSFGIAGKSKAEIAKIVNYVGWIIRKHVRLSPINGDEIKKILNIVDPDPALIQSIQDALTGVSGVHVEKFLFQSGLYRYIAKESGLTDAARKQLYKDIVAKADLAEAVAENNGLVGVWKRIAEAAQKANPELPDAGKILRTDLPSLNSLLKFNNVLITKIGQQRFDDFLKSLIEANPKCASCGNLGDVLVGKLDDVLDDFHKVVTVRAVNPDGTLVTGFDSFIAEAGEQASKAKGAALTLRKMSRNWDELTENGAYRLKGFEGDIPDVETDHKLDLLLSKTENNVEILKSVEMKNWKEARRHIRNCLYSV